MKKVEKNAVSEENIAQMIDFGYSRAQAVFGLSNTENNVERAIDYLCNHPMVAEEEKHPVAGNPQDTQPGIYRLHGNNKCNIIHKIGFITHLGSSANAGHWVAHVRKDGKWVYFNDLKVGTVENPAISMGSIYFFIKQ